MGAASGNDHLASQELVSAGRRVPLPAADPATTHLWVAQKWSQQRETKMQLDVDTDRAKDKLLGFLLEICPAVLGCGRAQMQRVLLKPEKKGPSVMGHAHTQTSTLNPSKRRISC
eukprot:Polyplicarium_translucidae@DN3388_c4_g1_i10.p4